MTNEQLDELVGRWHKGAGARLELHEYLGWTWEQYVHWGATGEMPVIHDEEQREAGA